MQITLVYHFPLKESEEKTAKIFEAMSASGILATSTRFHFLPDEYSQLTEVPEELFKAGSNNGFGCRLVTEDSDQPEEESCEFIFQDLPSDMQLAAIAVLKQKLLSMQEVDDSFISMAGKKEQAKQYAKDIRSVFYTLAF